MNNDGQQYKNIFVSIPIERHFLRVFAKYRDKHGTIPYLRFIPLKKLHVTVLYIGAVPVSNIGTVEEIVASSVARYSEFGLTLEKVSYAPPEKSASMVWAYFKENDTLTALSYEITKKLTAVGITPQDSHKGVGKVLVPHITLARFTDKQVRVLTDLRRTELEGYIHVVKEIELLESTNSNKKRNGAEYKKLATFRLGKSV